MTHRERRLRRQLELGEMKLISLATFVCISTIYYSGVLNAEGHLGASLVVAAIGVLAFAFVFANAGDDAA